MEWVQIKEPILGAAMWRDEADSLNFTFTTLQTTHLIKQVKNLHSYVAKNNFEYPEYRNTKVSLFKGILVSSYTILQWRQALKWADFILFIETMVKYIFLYIPVGYNEGDA